MMSKAGVFHGDFKKWFFHQQKGDVTSRFLGVKNHLINMRKPMALEASTSRTHRFWYLCISCVILVLHYFDHGIGSLFPWFPYYAEAFWDPILHYWNKPGRVGLPKSGNTNLSLDSHQRRLQTRHSWGCSTSPYEKSECHVRNHSSNSARKQHRLLSDHCFAYHLQIRFFREGNPCISALFQDFLRAPLWVRKNHSHLEYPRTTVNITDKHRAHR